MPQVLILLGSKSDAEIGKKAKAILDRFKVTCEMKVASAHRTPERVRALVTSSDADVFIAVAGLSAALPGVIASFTTRPVIGVPISGNVNLDSILSIVQMPPGIPVASVGLDRGDNAALLAVSMLSIGDPKLKRELDVYRGEMAEKVERDSQELN
ncbi:MAG: 5-(carboxyamino)imidazole ribonucleotide mutase [Methanomassiliicoccales archaeon]|jgi:5-(carboxyamino)imidazole ribonucleotide mutase